MTASSYIDESKIPCRETKRLHTYAAYYHHANTKENTWMYIESMNQYSPGETIQANNGIDTITIDFEL